jgi:pimeloyl-ACP methyl ester carboxylesterase
VASAADDVRVIAEALGYDRIGVWGISGGGPSALACAALLLDLVVAVVSVASLAPYGVEGFDYLAGMGEGNVEAFKSYFSDPEGSRREMSEDREKILEAAPEEFVEAFESLLSPADAEVFTGDLLLWLVENQKLALSAGDQGWWDNGAAYLADWGFDVRDIQVPVKIVHGRQDQFVPVQHGEWLAANVVGAESEISDRDGHVTMIGRADEFHDWILQHFYVDRTSK